MKRRLSSRLSPQAKKVVLQSPDEPVIGILEVASDSTTEVTDAIASLGGKVRSTLKEANSVTFEIDGKHLADLADVDGVVYVSTQERYQT
jgi:hypothetical protein